MPIRVVDGPFSGARGRIIEVYGERAEMEIEIFGRMVRVEMDCDWIEFERADENPRRN